MKTLLCLLHTDPHSHLRAAEALDLAIGASCFDMRVLLCFCNAALLQLKQQQDMSLLQSKNFTQQYKTLDLYDINTIYVYQPSLQAYGLTPNDLFIDVELITAKQLQHLITQQDFVVNL